MSTFITTSEPVDFDGLAAVMAAQKCYPDSAIILPQKLNNNVHSYLIQNRELFNLVEPNKVLSCSLLVAVNICREGQLGILASWLGHGAELHLYNSCLQKDNLLEGNFSLIENVGSTTTLMVEEIKKRNLALTGWEVTLMALGIYEATGNFMHSSTSKRDVAALDVLWNLGVEVELIQKYLYPQTQINLYQKTLLEKLISQTELYEICRRRILLFWAHLDDYSRGISELVLRVAAASEPEAIFCLVKMSDGIKLFAHSLVMEIDLKELLSFWEVEGHSQAVTITFDDTSLFRVRQDLLTVLQKSITCPVRARDIASYPVQGVDARNTVSDAINIIMQSGYGGLPVFEEEKAIGMITSKDLYKALRGQMGDAPVKSFIKKNIVCAGPNDSVSSLLRAMENNNTGRITITDESGDRLLGIVTRSDILRSLTRTPPPAETTEHEDGNFFVKPARIEDPETIEDLTPVLNRILSPRIQHLLYLIGRIAEKEDARVYLAGGIVRDLFMGRGAPKDLDLVVIPDAVSFARSLNRILNGELRVHESFGTASLFLYGSLRLDLVTARKEFYASPAALPRVEVSSLKNDLFRRDFSINTLACSLNHDSFGVVYDFFDGRKDLGEGIIKVLYNLSFVDDPLRILRAARLAARFGFQIEDETLSLIKKSLHNRLLDRVSRDRLNREIRLIFNENDPPSVLKKMDEIGALSFLFPRFRPGAKTWYMLAKVKETVLWSRCREWKEQPDEELLYLGALFFDLKPEEVRFLGARMKLSRNRIDKLVFLVEEVPGIINKLQEKDIRPGALLNLLGNLPNETLLLIRSMAPNSRVRKYPRLYWDSLQHINPRIDGSQLKQLGLEPGPLFGRILQELKEAIADGRVRSYNDERQFVLSALESEKGVS